VLDRTDGKFISAMPFVSKISWAKGIDSNGRPIYNDDFRPGDPSKSADGRRARKCSRFRPSSAARTRCDRLFRPDEAVLRPVERMGHGHPQRAGRLQEGRRYLGAGFNIKPVFDDHIGSLKAIDPVAQKVVWEYKNKAPLWAAF